MVKTKGSAAAEFERLQAVRADTELALAAAREDLEAATKRLAEADELAVAVVLGECDAEGVARKRAGAVDDKTRAQAEISRCRQVLEGLGPRLEQAKVMAAQEVFAGIVGRLEEAGAVRTAAAERLGESLEAAIGDPTDASMLAAAVAATRELDAAREACHALERDTRAAAEAIGEDLPPLAADEPDWRPRGRSSSSRRSSGSPRSPGAAGSRPTPPVHVRRSTGRPRDADGRTRSSVRRRRRSPSGHAGHGRVSCLRRICRSIP